MSEAEHPSLCVFVCQDLVAEARAVAEAWPDVEIAAFACQCGLAQQGWPAIEAASPPCASRLLIGCPLLRGFDPQGAAIPTEIIRLEQCMHLLISPSLAQALVEEGAYLITPGWLACWPERLATLGLVPPWDRAVFGEIARELVLLDTGVDPEAPRHLSALSAALGLPARRLAVGLDYARLWLGQRVMAWRADRASALARAAARQQAGALAEHVAAVDMLSRLAQARQEAGVIEAIKETLQMLFAPQRLIYLPIHPRRPLDLSALPPALRPLAREITGDYAMTPQGFLLKIRHGAEALGLILVDELAFPQQRRRYLSLALALTSVCGLAVRSARSQARLVEVEKMASLSALVAGVAHEISTPAGISRAAASHLEGETARLLVRFEAQAMTRRDLEAYLAAMTSGLGLVHAHLQRIGALIDAFRRVAITPAGALKEQTPLRALIDALLASLAPRLNGAHVEVACPEGLEISGAQEDWRAVLLNLLSNSLKHGFKGREGGRIWLDVEVEAQRLRLSYRDDGVGLSPEARQRLFDPFFTTDMQRGMGLGMHLVYNLVVHRLNGEIHLINGQKQGVHFQIEVPR
ncbi:histidine kinase [Myxococcota bacterium]|nr:histidine kinase [Myxococcota bacterium]MBU1898463.1 histidine kinase [Myxococcota bacterium]